MKSKIHENRYVVECSCGTPDHMLVFDYDPEYELIDVSFQYNKYESFWKRFLNACKYLFKQNDLYWQGVVIHSEDIEDIEWMIQDIKKVQYLRLKQLAHNDVDNLDEQEVLNNMEDKNFRDAFGKIMKDGKKMNLNRGRIVVDQAHDEIESAMCEANSNAVLADVLADIQKKYMEITGFEMVDTVWLEEALSKYFS